MTSKQKLIKWSKSRGFFTGPEAANYLKISRQTATKHLRELVEAGHLHRVGSTRNAKYCQIKPKIVQETNSSHLTKLTLGLEEDLVFEEVSLRLNLKSKVNSNVYSIAYYAFCEMLNNAIDHSKSKKVDMTIQISPAQFEFAIRDYGVGLFENVRKEFKLGNQYEAIDHVLKGKQTTMPERHSGQGLFFTSRIADHFEIRSHEHCLSIDNQKKDFKLGKFRFISGTKIQFSIKRRSKKSLTEIFEKYANQEFEFDKGEVRVRVLQQTGLMSRSQARRLTAGLEAYAKIIFDFEGVKEIGQAFTDEIFRVFANRNPNIELSYINAIKTVEFMIWRARNNT